MTFEKDYAILNLDNAGITDPVLRKEICELLSVIARHQYPQIDNKLDLFARLVRHENLPHCQAIQQAREMKDLKPWQRFVLNHFPESDFQSVPDQVRRSGVWRCLTWQDLVSDTIYCQGTQMPAILSMAYKPATIVEMGVFAGTTTMLLCKLNPESRIYGIDNHSRFDDSLPIGYMAMMQDVRNLTLAFMPSWEFSLPGQVDLCFIDADHTGDAPYKDSVRAWENRNISGQWCIAWDDYHPNQPDVKNAVDRFVTEVNMPLQKLGSWVFIGTIPVSEMQKYIE